MTDDLGLTQDDFETIREAHDRGLTLAEAEHQPPRPSEWVTADECAQMRELALSGMTSCEIAEEVKRSRPNVRKHLRGACGHDGGLEYSGAGGTHDGEWQEP